MSLRQDVPFSKSVLSMIIQKLHLSSATPWVLGTNDSHFQRYSMGGFKKASRRIGIYKS